jgi:hypothetical protein
MICFHVSLSGSKGRSPNLDHVSLWKTARGGEVLTRDEARRIAANHYGSMLRLVVSSLDTMLMASWTDTIVLFFWKVHVGHHQGSKQPRLA